MISQNCSCTVVHGHKDFFNRQCRHYLWLVVYMYVDCVCNKIIRSFCTDFGWIVLKKELSFLKQSYLIIGIEVSTVTVYGHARFACQSLWENASCNK